MYLLTRAMLVADPMMHVKSEHHLKDLDDEDDLEDEDDKGNMMGAHHHHHHHMLHHHHHHHSMMLKDEMKDCGVPIPATKPKIWSLADTAACKTPPPSSLHNQQPWCNPGNANAGMNMSINGFALPTSSMSNPSSGAPSSSYSRYSGFFGNPYSNSMGHSQGHSNSSNCGPVGASGFSEVQTDTPPQTPPNMKVPNNVITGAGSQQPCFPPQSVVSPNTHPQSAGYSNTVQSHNPSNNNNNTYSNNNNVFTQSPQKDRSESLSYHQHASNTNNPAAGAAPSNTDSTAFKPFYKR